MWLASLFVSLRTSLGLGPATRQMIVPSNSRREHFCHEIRNKTCLNTRWMDDLQFYILFKSYQDDVWVIMKGCVQWNSAEKI